MEGKAPKKVGYAMSTWRIVKEFQEGLRELEKRISMHQVRDYLASGRREAGVPEALYEEIDRLRELRAKGIRQEMKYARAQATARGGALPEGILQGYDLMAIPPRELLEAAPSLGIYSQFVWLGERE